jgi:hypothetical protein
MMLLIKVDSTFQVDCTAYIQLLVPSFLNKLKGLVKTDESHETLKHEL